MLLSQLPLLLLGPGRHCHQELLGVGSGSRSKLGPARAGCCRSGLLGPAHHPLRETQAASPWPHCTETLT